ncbi:ParB/RepB/Spo0J family partition protein [Bifidobacterium choerinum]|uniref:ParB/RepB/Spo0J family partition protein n=1 Tax=Bifidobacterium choerinum TaxID=35760 RepID=UPI003F92E664
MASKSRLGRGLGALFPSLPGEQPARPVTPAAKPQPKPAAKKPTEGKPAAKQPAQQQPAAGDQSSAPISPLSSTIPSMGAMTRHGDTVSKLAAPMTLQPEAAEHRPIAQNDADTSSSAQSTKTSSKRAAMPAIGDMAHPSDMFFDGTPIVAKTDAKTQPQEDENGLKPVEGGYLVELEVTQIGPNLHQPRTVFDDDELRELSESIKEVGVLQPIVVRKRPVEQIRAAHARPKQQTGDRFADQMDSEYELIMGERRWRASRLAGLKTIPAIVKTTADDYMLRDALLENLHRVALNPLEEAAAYQQMIDEFGLTQMQLARSVSKSRPQIANTLRLMNLPASVQKTVASGKISAGHARALLGLSDAESMEALAKRIVDEGLSVRSVEEIVSMQASDHPKKPKANKHNPWAGSPIQVSLEQRYGTKVSIKGSEKHGRIEIVFSSPEEMERIIGLLDPQ